MRSFIFHYASKGYTSCIFWHMFRTKIIHEYAMNEFNIDSYEICPIVFILPCTTFHVQIDNCYYIERVIKNEFSRSFHKNISYMSYTAAIKICLGYRKCPRSRHVYRKTIIEMKMDHLF